MNYATRLSAYNFTILYRKGSSNANADVLSRYPVIPLKDKKISDDKSEVCALTVKAEDQNAVFDNLLLFQHRDPLFRSLLYYLETGKLDPNYPDYYSNVRTSAHLFSLGPQGELRRINRDNNYVICVPKELRGLVMHDAHETDMTAHGGREKTIRRISSDYWWPTMYRDIEQYLQKCQQCLQHKRSKSIVQPMGTRPEATRVWERLHMDIWSPGADSESVSGNKYVLAFVDYVTKYLVVECIPNRNADTVSSAIVRKIICAHGPPHEIVSDGAAEFRSELLSELHRSFGITRRITTPYRPQANGLIERVFATIRPMLASVANKTRRKWDEFLPYVVYAYNTSYHRSINSTPFYLFYGRDPEIGIRNITGIPNDRNHSDMQKRQKLVEKARQH